MGKCEPKENPLTFQCFPHKDDDVLECDQEEEIGAGVGGRLTTYVPKKERILRRPAPKRAP